MIQILLRQLFPVENTRLIFEWKDQKSRAVIPAKVVFAQKLAKEMASVFKSKRGMTKEASVRNVVGFFEFHKPGNDWQKLLGYENHRAYGQGKVKNRVSDLPVHCTTSGSRIKQLYVRHNQFWKIEKIEFWKPSPILDEVRQLVCEEDQAPPQGTGLQARCRPIDDCSVPFQVRVLFLSSELEKSK